MVDLFEKIANATNPDHNDGMSEKELSGETGTFPRTIAFPGWKQPVEASYDCHDGIVTEINSITYSGDVRDLIDKIFPDKIGEFDEYFISKIQNG